MRDINLINVVIPFCVLLSISGVRAAGTESNGQGTNEQSIELRKVPAGQEFSGFLKDYSNLKPNPTLDRKALTFAKTDARKNLHKYIAVIVEPVQVYLASDADESKLPDKARGVGARYFHKALVDAVSSAFPVTDEPGPLVLRLRSALIGVDVGAEVSPADKSSDPDGALDRTVNIGKVAVEMELVDSDTGEQIAAMVDREPLGAGAEIGSVQFSKQEKWAAARHAFDGWAHDLRNFLDNAHELSSEDAKRADESYQPYGRPEDK
ncbi:MAG: DUF3313 domain-containing protein [Bryobacteraceae bacterium]